MKRIQRTERGRRCETRRERRKARRPVMKLESEEKALETAEQRSTRANYGAGRIRRYNLDVTMLCGFNSKERTLPEFIDIG